MTLTLLIIGHIVIGVSGYVLTRREFIRDCYVWTIGLRTVFGLMAMIPVLNIILIMVFIKYYVVFLIKKITHNIDWNKEAKW
jgi:hypothetical protein